MTNDLEVIIVSDMKKRSANSLDVLLGLGYYCGSFCICAKCRSRATSPPPQCACTPQGVCGLVGDEVVGKCEHFNEI